MLKARQRQAGQPGAFLGDPKDMPEGASAGGQGHLDREAKGVCKAELQAFRG